MSAEMERLRVRLGDMPGLDPIGLWAYVLGEEDDERHLVISVDSGGIWLDDYSDGYRPADVWLTTFDAATRDRIARWVAERVGLRVGSSAPALLCDEQEQHQWRLVAAPSFLRYAGGITFDGDAEDGPAGLRTLRAEDHRTLPDGSRWVDAVALAEVARFLAPAVAPR